MNLLSLLYFILILGSIVLVHEFGHFFFSKLFGVYVYEFSIGMGPKLFHYKKKNGETEYCIRLIPIGGFVSLAGEDADDNKKIPEDRKLYAKPVWQRLIIMIAGAMNNFIFAIIILFIIGLINGTPITKPEISNVTEDYPAYEAGIESGDTILSINGTKISSYSDVQLFIQTCKGKKVDFVLIDKEGKRKEVEVLPKEVKDEEDNISYVVGIQFETKVEKGFVSSVKYAFTETYSIYRTMLITLKLLFTGGVSVKDMSGPVGIYTIVDSQASGGIFNLLYLLGYLSINIGAINLVPFPAFDGGRVLFLIIEKIIGKKISSKVEGIVNTVGFGLLILLMVYVTFNDVLRLF